MRVLQWRKAEIDTQLHRALLVSRQQHEAEEVGLVMARTSSAESRLKRMHDIIQEEMAQPLQLSREEARRLAEDDERFARQCAAQVHSQRQLVHRAAQMVQRRVGSSGGSAGGALGVGPSQEGDRWESIDEPGGGEAEGKEGHRDNGARGSGDDGGDGGDGGGGDGGDTPETVSPKHRAAEGSVTDRGARAGTTASGSGGGAGVGPSAGPTSRPVTAPDPLSRLAVLQRQIADAERRGRPNAKGKSGGAAGVRDGRRSRSPVVVASL